MHGLLSDRLHLRHSHRYFNRGNRDEQYWSYRGHGHHHSDLCSNNMVLQAAALGRGQVTWNRSHLPEWKAYCLSFDSVDFFVVFNFLHLVDAQHRCNFNRGRVRPTKPKLFHFRDVRLLHLRVHLHDYLPILRALLPHIHCLLSLVLWSARELLVSGNWKHQ